MGSPQSLSLPFWPLNVCIYCYLIFYIYFPYYEINLFISKNLLSSYLMFVFWIWGSAKHASPHWFHARGFPIYKPHFMGFQAFFGAFKSSFCGGRFCACDFLKPFSVTLGFTLCDVYVDPDDATRMSTLFMFVYDMISTIVWPGCRKLCWFMQNPRMGNDLLIVGAREAAWEVWYSPRYSRIVVAPYWLHLFDFSPVCVWYSHAPRIVVAQLVK